jgi:hypothetical protein
VLNFTADLNPTPHREDVQVHRAEVPMVQERVTVTPIEESPEPAPAPEPAAKPIHVPVSTSAFEWEKVRDYVVDRILAVHGPFPRDIRKENTIFMGFVGRWEDVSMKIARYAFEVAGGEWLGAPVSVHRFHKTSDPVFAAQISSKL